MNNTIKLDCSLETRISKSKGTPYQVIIIKLTDSYEKQVFLDNAEVELVKMSNRNNNK